jgi:hypothetical protein
MAGWVRIDADGFRWTVRRSAREELARSLLGRGGDPGPALPLPRLRRGRSFHALPSEGGGLFVKRRPTLMFNGYAEQVASLYSGLDLKANY